MVEELELYLKMQEEKYMEYIANVEMEKEEMIKNYNELAESMNKSGRHYWW